MEKENYLRISELYKKLGEEFLTLAQRNTQLSEKQVEKIREEMNISDKLYFDIVNVYVEETMRKAKLGLQRKSGVLLGKSSNEVYINFFNKEIQNGYYLSEYEDNSTFLIVRDQNNKPKSVIRFITDLGYQRGSQFGRKELTEITNISKKVGINKEQVIIVVVSMVNSLDEKDVRKVLNDQEITNRRLLQDKDKMEIYVKDYINSFSHILPNPEKKYSSGLIHYTLM